MDDLLREFLTESAENLLRLEQEIVLLEQRPDDADLLGSIFRSMHTIKGTCGFLGLERLESVAHASENVLGALRDGSLEASDGVVSDILASIDVIKEILEGLEAAEVEPEGDDGALIDRLNTWLGGGPGDEEDLDALFAAAQAGGAADDDRPHGVGPHAAGNGNGAHPDAPRATASGAPDSNGASSSNGAAGSSAPPPPSDARSEAPSEAPSRAQGGDRRNVADSTLRVDVDVLDLLMNLAGELVLTRNQLMQIAGKDDQSAYQGPVQQLNRVTTDLQEAVMKTRMQPIGNAWGKLPRLVRDLAAETGKNIDLVMMGAETELDRQILQAIRDPLTHMVRNSGDHGIETPDVRSAAGKPEQGRIVLEAFHEGGHIVIEIRDDGKGLDVEAIRTKAVERGLASAEEVADLPDHRVFDFIFQPGFSTAAQVTSVSGRGVGMDVVRRNIDQIGGTIEVESTPGAGSTFRIKIPLTLAIMSALIVGTGGQSFAVPQIGVLELVRISEENRQLLEDVNGSSFYRLRDSLLPLVRLDTVLGLDTDATSAGEGSTDGARDGSPDAARGIDSGSIVVCQVGPSRFGLVVEEILDTEEIVVKPVGRLVKHLKTYAGTTILGDGSVIMILDVPGIALEADVLSRNAAEESAAQADEAGHGDDVGSYLLFDAGVEAPRALELELVSRLEEIPADDIEWAAGRWVVQYRGHLLPLVPASEHVRIREVSPRPVIVIGDGASAFGLAVQEIRDIVRERIEVSADTDQVGLAGTAVLNGRTTEMIDIDHFRAAAGSYPAPPVRNRIRREEAVV